MFLVIQGDFDRRNGDTMILDSVAGHGKTYATLAAFLASGHDSIELASEGRCSLWPDAPVLRTLRMVKTDGLLMTEELARETLQISGRPELLARYIETFRFDEAEDGDHRHPELRLESTGDLAPESQSVIIEACDDP